MAQGLPPSTQVSSSPLRPSVPIAEPPSSPFVRAGANISESGAPPLALVFEEVSTLPPPNGTLLIDAISTPSIDAPIPDQLAYADAAAKVFRKSVLRRLQVIAVHKLVIASLPMANFR